VVPPGAWRVREDESVIGGRQFPKPL